MPNGHGGPRVGAGRPRKRPKVVGAEIIPIDIAARKAAAKKGTPLAYMLAVMRDVTADDSRRDRMAVAAAPYFHLKASERPVGKKQAAEDAAVEAGSGTDWGADLAKPGAEASKQAG